MSGRGVGAGDHTPADGGAATARAAERDAGRPGGPGIPPPGSLWRATAPWLWATWAILVLWPVPHYIVQYWFNQSLGYRTLFWTNVRMQAALFLTCGTLLWLATWLPLRRHAAGSTLRAAASSVGIWLGTLGGWLLARQYAQFLLAFHGVPFGETDPVFDNDIGFYVYLLPALEMALWAAGAAALVAVVSFLVGRWDRLRLGAGGGRRVADLATPDAAFLVGVLGLIVALQTWLGRYHLLVADNESTGVRAGAAYLDLVGPLSRLNLIHVGVVVELGLTATACWLLLRLHRRRGRSKDGAAIRGPAWTAAILLAVELCFYVGVVVRDHVAVAPNEPYIQRPYIERHIDATLRAYRLDDIAVREWMPPAEPASAEELLESRTLRNAPYVSSWVSYLEEPPDIQHYERIAISDSTMVYGPLLQIYEQQQQLRPYYRFLSVDGVRYTVDGEKRMYASAVRELPSRAFVGTQEWLRYWGSAALLFTHGMGLVMSPVNAIDEVGNPLYVVDGVPPRSVHPELEHEPRIYFGEGLKDDYVLTNVRGLREFDYATDQFRSEFAYPADLRDGIPVSSAFRRLVFGLYSGDVTAFLFSRFIDEERTRVHIRRTPVSRVAAIAPFLYLDTNVYAFIADGHVLWMVNGLTTTDRYPYSFPEVLGDKADERAVEKVPERFVNYGEDSVKVTVDAYSGEVRFYKIADDPIVETWARVYPDLFEPEAAMPESVRAQLTYPLQWFHLQFDDIYKRYHQVDPIEFYNVEDLWDDADETLGSIGRGLSGFGTGDQMTFSYEGYNALLDPEDLPPGVDVGAPGELQYAMLMPFTPEGARNLRSLVIAFQDPGSYGRLVDLRIPQGTFVPGPEQVDAYIDNDRPVHQQLTMWIRHASEVIRGSTLLLPVRGDLLYVETLWVSSLQNEMPQLKLFAVRYHGRITSGATLEEAILRRQLLAPDMRRQMVERRDGRRD